MKENRFLITFHTFHINYTKWCDQQIDWKHVQPFIVMLSFTRSFAKSPVQSLQPLWDYCLVQRFVTPEKTNSGLYIPDAVKGRHNEGLVIATGPGKRDKKGNYTPLTLKPGDRVYLADWSANEVKFDGKEYLLVREEDILGKLK